MAIYIVGLACFSRPLVVINIASIIKDLPLLYWCLGHPQEPSWHICPGLVVPTVLMMGLFPSSLTPHFVCHAILGLSPMVVVVLKEMMLVLPGSFQTFLAFTIQHLIGSFLETSSSSRTNVSDFYSVGVFVANYFL
jgi:hypothetical protein